MVLKKEGKFGQLFVEWGTLALVDETTTPKGRTLKQPIARWRYPKEHSPEEESFIVLKQSKIWIRICCLHKQNFKSHLFEV